METKIKDDEYAQLMVHIDDLKKMCETLKVNVGLLELPIRGANTSLLSLELDSSDSLIDAVSSDSSDESI